MPFFLAALIPAAVSTTTWMMGAFATTAAAGGAYAYARSNNQREQRQAYERGRNEARAEYDLRLERFQQQVTALRETDSRYYKVLIAVVRVAYSEAHEAGRLNQRTRRDIDEYLMGELRSQLPPNALQKIEMAYVQPMPLQEARQKARQYVGNQFLGELCQVVEHIAA